MATQRCVCLSKTLNFLRQNIFRFFCSSFECLIFSELIDIPDELGHCVNLVSLNLSMNIISELPKCIVNLKQLTSLIVADNSLTQLPVYIDELFNLQHLDASQCDLRFLPAEIVNLPRLRVLELCENNLTELVRRRHFERTRNFCLF